MTAESSDEDVATVSVEGKTLTVTGVSRGEATITVTAEDDSEASNDTSAEVQFKATVPNSQPVVASISDVTVRRAPPGTATVTVEVTDGDAGDTHEVTAESSDEGVATVSVSGKNVTLTAVSRGSATITVGARDDSQAPNATAVAVEFGALVPNSQPVVGPISDVTVSRGSTVTITVSVTDGDSGDTHEVTATSSDTSVATVSVSGQTLTVSGVAVGSATVSVTATDNSGAPNHASSAVPFTVTVTAPLTPNNQPVVSPIADQTVMIGPAHKKSVPVTVTDADKEDTHTIEATSADATIASVAVNGSTLTITGVAAGGARITVTADDGKGADNSKSKPVTFMASVRAYTGGLRAHPNPSNDGSYTLSWDARDNYPYHVLLEGDVGESPMKVYYPGESLEYQIAGKAPGTYRYELHHCDFDIDDIPYTLTLGSGSCAGTGIPEVTVKVNLPAGRSNIATDTEAGATPYRTGVTQGGDAYVNIPIEPAPGVNGLVPMVSIDYSGGRDRELAEQSLPWDTLGYGWHLSGFSTIRRCFVNQQDGSDLLATDNLCLDGEPLVLTSGSALQPGAVYRLLRERFVKVTVKGTAPHVWFEAKGPDGSVSEYGNTEDSQLHRASDYFNGTATMDKAFQWSINRRKDAFNNSMVYVYHEDESSSVRHPLRIEYGNGGDAAIVFRYVHRSDLSSVMLGSSSTYAQAQNLLLREVRVLRDWTTNADGTRSGTLVRTYRLQTAPDGAKRRLDRVQLCGYGETGGGEQCLAPIDIDWTMPHEDLSAVVNQLTDSLGRKTEFVYGVLQERASHAFLFAERPFGNAPGNIAGTTSLGDDDNDADEVLKTVVTKMRRANGLVDTETETKGWHETSYAYQGRGRMSDRHWGFLGFDATRSTDGESGVVTYRRYRMDFPHYGEVAAVYEYEGAYSSTAKPMYKRVTTHAVENISHGGTPAAQTKLPRVDGVYEFHYEGGVQIGATKTDHALSLTSGLPTSSSTTTVVYHTLAPPNTGARATWGAVPGGTGSAPQRKMASSATFANIASGGKWVIGFANRTEARHYHYKGATPSVDVTDVTTFGRSGNATNTLRPSWMVRFSGNADHELTTIYTYDDNGNAISVKVTEGNSSTDREEKADRFIDRRYPGTLTNAADHDDTLTYDARFGLVKTLTDPNNRTTTLKYDAFGRETQRTTPDQVIITTAYQSCADSGVDCAAVAGGGTDASVTPVMRIKESSPIAPATWRYLDKLGRTIRTETEGFALNTRVRRDTRYDARGRVERASQPHYSNETAHYREYTYDIRGRVLSETRPDGGVTTMRYTVDPEDRNRIKATATEQVYQRGRMGTPTKVATRETVSLYNVMGELVSRTEGANEPRTTDTATVSMAYNGAGQPTTYTAAGAVTKHLYDSAGFRERLASPDFGRVTFEYNRFGELRERTDGKGTTTWKYDVLGRPKTRKDPDGVAEWSYDPTRAIGSLARRCYEKGADAAGCAGLCGAGLQ